MVGRSSRVSQARGLEAARGGRRQALGYGKKGFAAGARLGQETEPPVPDGCSVASLRSTGTFTHSLTWGTGGKDRRCQKGEL